jgi:hypothetical protein
MAPSSRACRRSIFARPYIWRFTSFSFVIRPSVWPFDQGSERAARTAALSRMMPLAKHAMAHAGGSDPWIEICDELLSHHGLKAFDEHAGFDECGNVRLDGGDGDCFCFAKIVARGGHQSRDSSRGRNFLQLIGRLRGSSSPCRPLADYTQGALEALPLQATPELCAVTAALGPLRVQKGQVGIERALPCPEDIRTLTATNLANEFTAVFCSTDDLLERHGVPDERQMASFVCLRRRYPSYCSLSARVSSSGLIVVAPTAVRIARMERRTALRRAALAFSIRCQRSATWTAAGSAFAAASP